jgi:hypothetical protein
MCVQQQYEEPNQGIMTSLAELLSVLQELSDDDDLVVAAAWDLLSASQPAHSGSEQAA